MKVRISYTVDVDMNERVVIGDTKNPRHGKRYKRFTRGSVRTGVGIIP